MRLLFKNGLLQEEGNEWLYEGLQEKLLETIKKESLESIIS